MRLPIIRSAAIAAIVVLAAASQTSAQAHERAPIAGTITAGSDGNCTPPAVSGPLLRWSCTDSTETYAGGLTSTADAVFDVTGTLNTRSGATKTRGSEIFTGCVGDVCGTLEWRWHAHFSADPETAAVVHGSGQARITGGTGGLAGAKGSFAIKCDESQTCTYEGHVLM
jgi:hypothetical protein